MIATLIKTMEDFTGHACLYYLDPPIEYTEYPEDRVLSTEYVIVSATIVPMQGAETYIFPCDSEGKVINWLELDGSCKGTLEHLCALNAAGYEIKEQGR